MKQPLRKQPLRSESNAALAIRLLVEGKSYEAVAAHFGLTKQGVHDFAKKHTAEIEKLRSAVDTAARSVLLANKQARIEQLDEMAAFVRDRIAQGDDSNARILTWAKLVRQIAEEKGELPKPSFKVSIEGPLVQQNRLIINEVMAGNAEIIEASRVILRAASGRNDDDDSPA